MVYLNISHMHTTTFLSDVQEKSTQFPRFNSETFIIPILACIMNVQFNIQ
jgi:hypothetical protein